MKTQNIRVMVASEYPETRSFLRNMVEADEKAVIVGQAENGFRAVNLARSLRPDIAIVDSHLPHAIGLDATRLSRTGGLDVAQTLCQEIPNIRVVLLSGAEEGFLPEGRVGWGAGVSFCREEKQSCVPFTVNELYQETVVPAGALVFARVEPNTRYVVKGNPTIIADRVILSGGLAFFVGWVLIITLMLAVPGIYLAAAGAAAALIGFAYKKMLRLKK